ncbi:hypothetical protein P153DRAFT_166439 [Dothidotthia symphoricarpi CBS 119687]|uniref:Uncharacterized protein n=1 Tax=Dothidotthia symphoricarpi CBS 119687 TaxID=1392245 RepID=A0A6A6ALU5_9PLEO|nr:uncharacterized protein P153DRAFT_166439 [Dothidotthia symphoricarpi CBS 119687]KAF2132526.1 hypothetical protein P153DRAFT_166439 [Dothidotthia symphoricarpi CBS 119687]
MVCSQYPSNEVWADKLVQAPPSGEHTLGLKVKSVRNASIPHLDGPSDYRPQIVPTTMRHLGSQQPQSRYQHQIHHRHQPQHHHQARNIASTQIPVRQDVCLPENAVSSLLPYCTNGAPMRQEQVIALTDVVGNLKELVILALSAASGHSESVDKLNRAVGGEAAVGVAEFFDGEWEVE